MTHPANDNYTTQGFVGRYMLIMGLFLTAAVIMHYSMFLTVTQFTYTAPLLSAFLGGHHFYHTENTSPLKLLRSANFWCYLIAINALFFFVMVYLFVDSEIIERSDLSVALLKQQLFSVVGIGLSEIYWRKHISYKTNKSSDK